MTILERTKDFIEAHDLTQNELAERAGISFVALSRFLNGKYSDGTILRLDRYLSEHEKRRGYTRRENKQ